jgi:hypothetical protein
MLEWSLDPLLAALDTHRDLAIELVAISARALLTGEP